MSDKHYADSKLLGPVGAHRYEELFQSIPVPSLVFDANLQITDCNHAAVKFFEIGADQILGEHVVEFLASSDQASLLNEIIGESLSTAMPEQFGWQFARLTGSTSYINCSVVPLPHQNKTGGIITCIDASKQRLYEQQIEEQLLQMNEYSMEIEQNRWELEQANQKLEDLARTDGLTGLFNHRHFQDTLAREMKLALRGGVALSVILLDVDHFKKYNDSFGHPAGDFVLKQIATVLTESARASDVVARYGGEEFAIILSMTDAEGAVVVAERVRAAVEGAEWPERAITASFGVASMGIYQSPSTLIKAADEALYAAKEAGRNRIMHVSQLKASRVA